ncbi:phage tail protein [Leptotrichia wadei]|uniref:phage tail-collar fiber domain-containing protein n=1 Tax=Leptotrichia wadei TaxID=157687 RepID=UPI000367852F|nr:phage tail protein [Leptotrichia wadei]
MAKFNGFILTEKGRELLAKGLSGETITFTKMAIGDGTSLTSERERTELVNQITTLPILNINVKRNGTCEINALLTNKSVTTGFYIKELGIFAHGNDNVEILYAYNISTSPDFVPPFSANNVVEIEYVDTIIVDQVANVTAVIDPSITYITKKYADENYLVSSRLAEILGLQFGGNIQDIGNKTKGKFYYDSVTKFYYECIEDNSLTYNDSGKFRAISNKPISDKVEKLFKNANGGFNFANLIFKSGNGRYQKSDLERGTRMLFGTPFDNSCLFVVAQDNNVGAHSVAVLSFDREGFKVIGRDNSSQLADTDVNWFAVGY